MNLPNEEHFLSNLDYIGATHSTVQTKVMVLPKPAMLSNMAKALSIDHHPSKPPTLCYEDAPTMAIDLSLSVNTLGLSRSSWHSFADIANQSPEGEYPSGNKQRSQSSLAGATEGPGASAADGGIGAIGRPLERRKSHYLGEVVWQVDEVVYCGGVEAVQNQNLLCRLGIEYIIDVSGQTDDPNLKMRPRSECPCLCPRRTAHSRTIVAIKVRDDSGYASPAIGPQRSPESSKQLMQERDEIIRYFEVIVDIIRRARIAQKRVLIHSLKGRNRAPAFVAAYLMHCNRCTRMRALAKISKLMSKMRPSMCVSDSLQRALMRWQSILGIRSELDPNSSPLAASSEALASMFEVRKTDP